MADAEEAIRLAPGDPRYVILKGIVDQGMGRLDRAKADFDEVVRLDPRSANALAMRAQVQMNRGDLGAALADLDAAIRLDPESVLYLSLRAWLRLYLNRPALAAEDYAAMIRLAPERPEGYRGRADAWARLPTVAVADPTRALADARRACELTRWEGWNELEILATVSFLSGDRPSATRWQEEAIRRLPGLNQYLPRLRDRLERYRRPLAGEPALRPAN